MWNPLYTGEWSCILVSYAKPLLNPTSLFLVKSTKWTLNRDFERNFGTLIFNILPSLSHSYLHIPESPSSLRTWCFNTASRRRNGFKRTTLTHEGPRHSITYPRRTLPPLFPSVVLQSTTLDASLFVPGQTRSMNVQEKEGKKPPPQPRALRQLELARIFVLAGTIQRRDFGAGVHDHHAIRLSCGSGCRLAAA